MTTPSRLVAALTATAAAASGLAAATSAPATAAPTDVVINEMMFHAVSDLDGDDYLELLNTGTAAVDLSGWSFSGITLALPAGTSIGPGAYLVVAKDAVQFQASYGFAPDAVYGGNLSNSGETITLKDATGTTIDTVAYGEADPWPVKADGTGPSLELVDATLDNNDALNWAAATNASGRTPGAANSVRRSGLGPRVTGVTPSTTTPAAGEAVTVTATVTGQTSATLRYRTDFAAEQSVPMTSTGGDTYAASIPGAAAGHLLRYRVEATNAVATTRSPRIDDTVTYRGVVVPSGISSPVPQWEWFISPTDYTQLTSNPTADLTRYGAIAYDGRVYDNVEMRIKGHASQTDPKVSWKFKTPSGYDFDLPGLFVEPVDEIDMQADWSDRSHGRAILSWDAYRRAGFPDHTMFPVRTQRNGAFQGLYNLQETYDGTWREREGFDDDQFFEAETSAFSTRSITTQFSKKAPDETDFAPISAFVSGVRLTGAAQRSYLLANADMPQMINYAAVTAIVEHHDSSSKNFYLVQDSVTGRWRILPWDLDHTLGNGCCNVESTFVTPAEPGDNTSALMRAVLADPTWRAMYFRRLRTLVDDLLAPGRMEALYDSRLGPAQPVAALDYAAWPYPGSPVDYPTFRKRLVNDLNARRTVFATDSRVPPAQAAAPAVVIDEVQHAPASGDTAGFVELYNPGTQAVDLSGWRLGGSATATLQPGTVVPARSALTVVASDPSFRTAYGTGVFVADRYAGSLPDAGTLTLTRADGSLADTVTYGGAGWPVPTAGQSLELLDPAADNDDGASWVLSSGSGTPGEPRSTGPVVTAPGAPVVGTATAGSSSATLTWTAPADDGGSAITGYLVRVVDTTGTQVGALRPTGAGATSLTVTGLANGTTYRLQVAATNAVGTGSSSALSNAVTPSSAATVPGAPVIGTPAQGTAGGTLSAIARWTPPTTNGGSAITGYRVIALRMSSADPDATVLGTQTSRVLGPNVKQYDYTLAAGTYRFQVVAINAVGTGAPSARSAAVVPR
ncbi:lamin tail domain-containing protein [Nocardioides zeicaulis]|uniref:Lamin tail domain-containing protein n=1 Tax=Nocardioides zeicaulis TaxID=1776857 RepID=A0ABV6DZ59_9ACTN